MKKIVLIVMALAGALAVQADDYPYLTFETADGTKTSVSSSSLTITIQNGKLIAGSNEFNLTDLSKMYFSTSDETTGIEELNFTTLDDAVDIYDLQGRKVNKDQMRRGVYVIKTRQGTRKVNVK
jgi:hypothetical protein